jgi:hypothetical protein
MLHRAVFSKSAPLAAGGISDGKSTLGFLQKGFQFVQVLVTPDHTFVFGLKLFKKFLLSVFDVFFKFYFN